MTTKPQDDVVDVVDRRAAISAAFDAADNEESQSGASAPEPTAKPAAAKPSDKPTGDDTDSDDPTPQGDEKKPLTKDTKADEEPTNDGDDQSTKYPVDKAPQSWRGAQKAKWNTLDPDVRQEVIRREREITRTLSETASARQLASQFHQTIQPFAARIQSLNVHPLQAIQRLLAADHTLHTGTKAAKATALAKIIADYDVDIEALDNALAGRPQPDPVDEKVERLLQQRLAPFQRMMTEQQQAQQQRVQQTDQELATTLQSMADDTEKFPYFNEIRGDMADIVEIQAKKGVYLTLEQAYNRAIAMNPEINQQVSAQRESEATKLAARQANERAQKALKASKSVGGSPGGVPSGATDVTDRRATIAAAFAEASGR